MRDEKRSLIAPLGGVVVGVAVFVGVNIATGRAIVPTVASVSGRVIESPIQPSGPAVTGPAYVTVCAPCHQAEGQGIPFAFPPLAGSEWLTGDPETPIRIVLLGLSGEIEVKGTKFNALMPPPGTVPLPGTTTLPPPLDDAKIAEAISYARSNFGNSASAVDADLVKKVRDSLNGRTTPWTAPELTALRTGTPLAGAGAAKAGAAPAEGAAAGTGKPRAKAASGTKKPRAKAAPAPAP